MEQRKLYELFKVEPTCKRSVIQEVYPRLAKVYHPDRAPAGSSQDIKDLANQVFSDLSKALETLTDPVKRVEYDLSVGVERDPEDEEEARVLAEHRKRYREIYKRQFPDRVEKAKHFAEMAEKAAAAGDVTGAVGSYKIALSFDPLNDEYKARMKELSSSG